MERGDELDPHRATGEPAGHGAQEPIRRVDPDAPRRHDVPRAQFRESLAERLQHGCRIEQTLDIFLTQEQQGHWRISFLQAYQVQCFSMRDETHDRRRHYSIEDEWALFDRVGDRS
jgi:hypothetical protein